jgi:cytochrome c
MLRDNECLKCHSVTRDKIGPAWEDVAAKYRGRPDAEERLVKHLTTAPIIDLDGNPETHRAITRMSEAQVRMLSRWLLSL